jgi:flagellar protein FliO/FliZ
MTATVPTSWLHGASGAAAVSPISAASTVNVLSGVDFIRVGIALAFCLALGVIAILVIRRHQRVTGSVSRLPGARRITVAETIRLGPRATLHLVEYDRRVILLASDATGVKMLDAHDLPGGAREA